MVSMLLLSHSVPSLPVASSVHPYNSRSNEANPLEDRTVPEAALEFIEVQDNRATFAFDASRYNLLYGFLRRGNGVEWSE